MDYIISIIRWLGTAAGAVAVRTVENDEKWNAAVGLCMWHVQSALAVKENQNQAKIPGDKMILKNVLSSLMANPCWPWRNLTSLSACWDFIHNTFYQSPRFKNNLLTYLLSQVMTNAWSIVQWIPVLCLAWTQNKNKLVKNLESSDCVIASSQNSNLFLKRFDRMHPWRPRRNFKPIKSQISLVGTNAFIKDSWRQCARLVKVFGTKLTHCHS